MAWVSRPCEGCRRSFRVPYWSDYHFCDTCITKGAHPVHGREGK